MSVWPADYKSLLALVASYQKTAVHMQGEVGCFVRPLALPAAGLSSCARPVMREPARGIPGYPVAPLSRARPFF